jgi:tartrate dehydratase alpha subunit/fumarate hydratase class I-like protein
MEPTELLPLGPDDTPYRLVTTDGVSTFETPAGTFLRVEPEAITRLTATAMHDIAHFLRPAHLAQLRRVLDDPEASDNDRFVALDLLKNASIAAGGILPMCQDTGTAIVKAKKGQFVFTGGGDEAAIAQGVHDTYLTSNLRYSQMAPLTMYDEINTGTNLPAEIKVSAVDGDTYSFLFIAKGGGSANKSYLFQETKALLNEATLLPWLFDKMQALGTAACPPYHLAVVIGGTSAEFAVETAKLASTHYLDTLPTAGSPVTGSATSSWRRRSSPSPSAPASGPSSAASTSATTYGSFASPATGRAARSPSPSPARRTGRPRARSPGTGCSSSSSRPTLPGSCPTSPTGSTPAHRPWASTSLARWTRSAPNCRGTRSRPG